MDPDPDPRHPRMDPGKLYGSLWIQIRNTSEMAFQQKNLQIHPHTRENNPWGGGEYQLMSFGGKNMKRRREKGGK